MEYLIVVILIALYPFIKRGCEQIVLDIVWLLFQPIKWIIKLIKHYELLSRIRRNRQQPIQEME